MLRYGTITLLPLLLCSGIPGWSNAADLETIAAALEPVPLEQRFEGVLEAVNRATVSAQTSGRIVEILFDVDDYVERGAVLFKFSATEQAARHQQAQAAAGRGACAVARGAERA